MTEYYCSCGAVNMASRVCNYSARSLCSALRLEWMIYRFFHSIWRPTYVYSCTCCAKYMPLSLAHINLTLEMERKPNQTEAMIAQKPNNKNDGSFPSLHDLLGLANFTSLNSVLWTCFFSVCYKIF